MDTENRIIGRLMRLFLCTLTILDLTLIAYVAYEIMKVIRP